MPPLRRSDLLRGPAGAASPPGSSGPSGRCRSPRPSAWRLSTPTVAPTRAWSCSRASAPRASASSPTRARRRAPSSRPLPSAALVFYWRELDRQVRVRGPVERVGADGGRRVLRLPRPGEPDRRLGEPAEPAPGRLARRARRAGRARSSERFAEDERRAAPALGRLPRRAARDRVLAGPGRAPPRPLPLRARRARGAVVADPSGALTGFDLYPVISSTRVSQR